MNTTVRSALNLVIQQINAVMMRFLSYFQIWTPTLSIKERQRLLKKAAKRMKEQPKVQRVVMPSKLITDPSFGYVNSALTDVSATWKKFEKKGIEESKKEEAFKQIRRVQ
jgi:hypothetical protein